MASTSTALTHEPPRRLACDRCRGQKLKCPGELPSCSRCMNQRATCSYSAQRPMGRPKKGVLDPTTTGARQPGNHDTPGHNNVIHPSPPLPETQYLIPDSASNNVDDQAIESFLTEFRGDYAAFGDYLDQLTAPAALVGQENASSSPSCDCMSNLCSALDKLGKQKQPKFPADLSVLRNATGIGMSALNCSICPKSFVSAMQNALSLGSLVISIAECYAKMLEEIKAEENRSSLLHESKVLQVTVVATRGTVSREGQTQMPEAFVLEANPSEWKSIAMKALRADVFGVSGNSLLSFVSLVNGLEQRQKRWHTHPPGSGFPDGYHICDLNDKRPPCLQLADAARKRVELLALE
ncbi:hypothetical protein F5Y04DRAFT_241560 [Hypomontagnella monticulosa]|nr:hypothetical protein F5Y04DRAFT_241560 [Hypomontagnella monticulosa]